MASGSKDTVYVDVDDEITTIIDKLQASDKQIVALVLPKRATVLQSIVNMKLLQRTAKDASKSLVLITSEASLLPLAGAVGLHTAKTLSSKPTIPAGPTKSDISDETEDVQLDQNTPIGELAGALPEDIDDVIQVDDAAYKTGSTAPKKPYNKKLKVPNFEKFRLKLFLIILGVILLIVGWYVAFRVVPWAAITIHTNTTTVSSEVSFTLSPTATEVNKKSTVIPATKKEAKKTDTEKAPATGQKNLGTKAAGTVTLKNCTPSDNPVTVPAGTTVSTNGLSFITQEDVLLPASILSGGSKTCLTSTKLVNVTAQNPGDTYNLSGGRTFTVAGFPNVSGVDSSSMSGGTTNNITIVTQGDIDGATAKIVARDGQAAADDLLKQFRDNNLLGIKDTMVAGTPTVTNSPTVNQEGSNVTVTATTTYTMLGIKEDDIKQLIDQDTQKKIDITKQGISDYGFDKAIFRLTAAATANGDVKMDVQTLVTVGPKLDADAIKQAAAGKKKGDATDIIQARPGVKDVTIKYSPFWVSKTPSKLNKITVTFIQSNGTTTTK